MRRLLVDIAILTLALGILTGISWLAFGGRAVALGPIRVLQERWPSIYASQALLAVGAAFGYLLLVHRGGRNATDAVVLGFGAWIGELVALTLGGSLLANEITPEIAWYWWLIATAGPMQPIAAIVGGLAGIAAARSSQS